MPLKPLLRKISFRTLSIPASLFINGENGGWYTTSDQSTLYTDSGATTNVTGTGQAVGAWSPKEGTFNNATQANSTQRPTYDVTSGTPYLNFDGSNDLLQISSVTAAFTEGYTVAVVFSLPGTSTGAILASKRTGASGQDDFQTLVSNYNLATISFGTSNTQSNTTNQPFTNNQFYYARASYNANTGDVKLSIDGTTETYSTSGVINDLSDAIRIGEDFFGNFRNQRVSELLILDRGITDQESEDLRIAWTGTP